MVGGLLVFILILASLQMPATKVVFLDVGQGDAILLQNGNDQILIDGGPDATVLQRLGEELPWFDHTINVVVATHPDKDHIAGLVHVLERYDVDLVLLPYVAHTSKLQNAWLEHIQEVIEKKETKYRFAAAGQNLQLSGLDIEVLHPEFGQAFGKKTNNGSVSTKVEFCGLKSPGGTMGRLGPNGIPRGPTTKVVGEAELSEGREGTQSDGARNHNCLSFLLTGDAEAVTERQLVAKYGAALDVDILKAGHHGSKTSSTEVLLEAASPHAVVISAGRDNQYGHPHPDVMARLKNYHLWRTDKQGSVRFVWNEGQWLTSTQK